MKRTPFRTAGLVLTVGATVLAGATVLGSYVASGARAVDIAGTLRVPSDFATTRPESEEELRRDHYWDEWNGFLAPRPRRFDPARDLAVVLRGEGPMAEEQPGFAIANGGLSPSTLVARTGSTLQVRNTDPCTHQIFAEGHSELNPTETSPGLTRQAVVNTAGSWPIRDEIYEHVRGHLHVIDDLVARAEVQSDGSYRFGNVPAGTYTLSVYHGDAAVHTQEGVIVEEGHELTIEPFTIGAEQ